MVILQFMQFKNLEITKNNYYKYFKNRKAWRNYKKLKKARPIIFSKYYKPVKSSIYNHIGISIHGGKSNRYSHYNI